jgi:hypothetical protein
VSGADDRAAEERARYLDRTTDLKRRKCLAVAYAELGYSDAGIAGAIDSTKATVTKYLDEVADRYGAEAVYPKMPDDRGDLVPVDEAELEIVANGEA